MKQKDPALSLLEQCLNDSNKTGLEQSWEKIAYFRSGEMLLWQDRSGRWRPIRADISYDGIYFDNESLVNYPKDAHMVTLDTGLMSKALGNPLIPEVSPFGSEDTDREAAQKCTNFLRAHREEAKEDRQTTGRSLREQVSDYLLGTGNAILKDYFDPTGGEKFVVDGQSFKRGKIVSKAVSPKAIRTPNGVTNWDELPWIIEETAPHVDNVKEKFGVEDIEPDADLEDPNAIATMTGSGGNRGDGAMKDHVRVYELYERPSEKNGHEGRKIIATRTRVLWEGVYDRKLASSRFGTEDWHPYSFGGWRKISSSLWCKTLEEELISLQVQLNGLWQTLLEQDPNFRGWWMAQEGTVDWEMVRNSYNTYGTNVIEYSPAARAVPQFVPPPIKNQDKMGEIQLCIQRMNDIAAQYETTRGNSDPNVTSGKQAGIMENASNSQATPLLTAIVNLFIAHWQKVLHLAAVHCDGIGEELRFHDPVSGDVVSEVFTPDQIESDDIVIFGGNAFYMTPESKRAEIEKLGSAGFFGDVVGDPVAKQKYLRLLELPFYDTVFADELADINAAKRENARFRKFRYQEDRQWVIGPVIEQYKADVMAWMTGKMAFEAQYPEWQKKQAQFNNLYPFWERANNEYQTMAGMASKTGRMPEDPGPAPELSVPPMDPGPQPEPPPLYWRAQEFEEHLVHIATHNQWRKSPEYEKLCRQNPELDSAMQFHIQTHQEFLNQAMIAAAPQLAGGNTTSGIPQPTVPGAA